MRASNMMLNPLNPKHLEKIPLLKAHLITLNLEDAIAPSRKKEALENIIEFLKQDLAVNKKIVVRVNALDEGGAKEIEALNPYNFLAIRLAKVRKKEEIAKVLELIREDKEVHISLETKEAFYNIREWKLSERFTTANLGILDLLNSLSLPQSIVALNNPTMDYILAKFLLDCKSVGLYPFSFMYQEYENLEEFRAWCEKEKLMGFEGKACMGPKQVEIANEIFSKSEDEIKRAKEIKEFFEKHASRGENGVMHEKYGFIDEPIYKDALLVLRGENTL